MASSWSEIVAEMGAMQHSAAEDGEWVGPKARASLLDHLGVIKQHIGRPDLFVCIDGEVSIEQHDGDRCVLCRVLPDGVVRISRWVGTKRTGEPIVLNGAPAKEGG